MLKIGIIWHKYKVYFLNTKEMAKIIHLIFFILTYPLPKWRSLNVIYKKEGVPILTHPLVTLR